jgi:glyoxylase-like metal-dependent hydrolase (beta-lactamase superfamily II)
MFAWLRGNFNIRQATSATMTSAVPEGLIRVARAISLRITLLIVSLISVEIALAQGQNLLLGEETTKVSDHIWAIMGFPNIGIVVGGRSVLVVDTGLGSRNGATVAAVAKRLAPRATLYLTTTHFHPEHAAGEGGFPPGTTLIRNTVQQQELEAHGAQIIALFSGRSEQQRELLANVSVRKPDITFDSEYRLDLGGGVKVRLLWFGGAHTKGDELVFVEPDKTLVSGDVVQNKVVPRIFGEGGTPSSWIAVLDQTQWLGALHVLPDHSAIGDGSLVAQEKAFVSDLQARALDLKRRGIQADAAGQTLTMEFKSKYPDWPINSVSDFVQSIYAE